MQSLQEQQYSIPYHYLPNEKNSVWRIGYFLWWGYEYLAVLDAILAMVTKGLFNIHSEAKVLDFGCGDGRLIVELLNRCPSLKSIVGVDISERALAFARAWTWGEKRVRFYKNISDVHEEFDIVIAVEVLEHIPPEELPSVINHIYAILADNGHFIISVPTTNTPLNRKHYQHFTLKSLASLVGSRFMLNEVNYIHRVGILSNLIRRAVINRLFIANNEWLLWMCTYLYKKFASKANEKTAAHLVCWFRKV